MADLDTGVGTGLSSRAIVRFTTTTSTFPVSNQIVGPSVGDTGTATAVSARSDVWDEAGRSVVASLTGSTFTTSNGGPA